MIRADGLGAWCHFAEAFRPLRMTQWRVRIGCVRPNGRKAHPMGFGHEAHDRMGAVLPEQLRARGRGKPRGLLGRQQNLVVSFNEIHRPREPRSHRSSSRRR